MARARCAAALDRPLSSYYLLLGASALLLTIGLIMVLSASSVYSLRYYDDSYAVVKRQLLWVLLGLPCAFIASRLSHSWVRGLAWPAYLVSLTLLLLTAFLGVERNGNQNWLAVGPLAIQPSEIAKLGLILWAANVYARKERRLGSVHHVMIPVVPGMLLATGLVVARSRPRHRAGAVRDPARDALGGRRPGPALRRVLLDRRRRGGVPGRDGLRAALRGSPTSPIRSRTTTTPAGSRPTASTPSRPAGGSARASAPPRRSGATCPRPTPTSSSRCWARSSASSARC